MKTSIAVLLLLALFISVESDKQLSFTLNGSLDPGFTFGRQKRSNARIHKSHATEHHEEVNSWPSPEIINNFNVPDAFIHPSVDTAPENNAADAAETPARNHRSRSHSDHGGSH